MDYRLSIKHHRDQWEPKRLLAQRLQAQEVLVYLNPHTIVIDVSQERVEREEKEMSVDGP